MTKISGSQSFGEKAVRSRILFYCAVLLAVQLAGFLFIVAGTSGWIVPYSAPSNADFVSFYAAGSLADAGAPELAYSRSAHLAAEQRATQPDVGYKLFYYPPVYLLLCAVLGHLPYKLSFLAFEGLTLALYLLAGWAILGGGGAAVIVPLLAFPEVFWALGAGQDAFLTAALFGAATLFVDRRPATSGLLFGALCYKPHFGLLVPVALAAGRRWRAFAAASASVLGLCSLSLLVFGWKTWRAFLVLATGAADTYGTGFTWYSVTPFGAMRMLDASPHAALAVQAGFTIAAAAFVAYVWRRAFPLPIRAAALLSATLVAVPVAYFYDLMLAAVAGAWLVRAGDEEKMPAWEKAALAALFLVPLGSRFLTGSLQLPIEPLAAFALWGVVIAHAFRYSRRALRFSPVVNGL